MEQVIRMLQHELVERYDYNVLPQIERELVRSAFKKFIPEGILIDGGSDPLFSKCGTQISTKYDRVVVGDYGAFIEISEQDIVLINLELRDGEEYRYSDIYFRKKVKYIWYTTRDDSDVKIYHQQKRVPYADYIVGKFYVCPFEVQIEKK